MTTTQKKPSERLLEEFIPAMEGQGYAYKKSGHRFVKPFAFGTHEWWLSFDGRGGLVAVDAAFFVRFPALEKRFEKLVGYQVSWCAGGTLLNAEADPWKFWMNEERFAAMTTKQLAAHASDEVHPPARVHAASTFLLDAHARYAVPFFASILTPRDLYAYLRAYLDRGCFGRLYPMRQNVLYLALLLAGSLGEDLDAILAHATDMKCAIVGHDIVEHARRIVAWIHSPEHVALPT
jgi:hypothetical protein